MGRERLMTAKKKILKTIAAAAVIIAALAAVSVLMAVSYTHLTLPTT